ncbi:MAG: DUF1553 domain-containing protein [Verrucomicrobia bacterium]|nr:MAG: DUF1553 domain-containing protein [Verrucomicrobiota bacterium]
MRFPSSFAAVVPRFLAGVACVWAVIARTGLGAAPAPTPPPVDFNRDIRPILSDHCYACHGPDEGKRKGGLRLDRQEDAFRELKSGKHALVAAKPGEGTLVERVLSKDPDEIMPPPKGGKPLSAEQIRLLKQWVAQGAPWKQHWSFVAPDRPPLPTVRDARWPRNDLDRFVLARLEKEGIAPAPEADKATLVRRATLDLTGLPPTIEEVDAFFADRSSDAYEKLVDRLLAAPQYGERMAANWLDLARYADTSGYHFDGVRFLWLWRDWVIDAFNKNKPYDQFTVEQLAGDLLPGATPEQRVATGFVRGNMTNDEGGADPDEYLNKYIVDRVNTLGAVWLGMTVGCAECHDHKYDPLASREFYRFYAFFHNVPEKGLDRIRSDNPPPRLPVPTPEQARKFVEMDFRLKDAEKTVNDRQGELGESQEKWERETNGHAPAPAATNDLVRVVREGEGTGSGEGKPEWTDALPGRALKLAGNGWLDLGPAVAIDRTNAFSYAAWVKIQADGAVLSRMEKAPGYRGFDLLVTDRRLQVHLVDAWPDRALKVKTKEQFPADRWIRVVATHDGTGKAAGLRVYVDGRARDLETERDALAGTLATAEPLRIGARSGEAQFKGMVGDVRFWKRALGEDDVRADLHHAWRPVIGKTGGKRTPEEQEGLDRVYKEVFATEYLRAQVALAKARQAKDASYGGIPTTLVMEEMDPPRDTFVLVRGDFRNKGEKVTAGVPAFLPPLPSGEAPNRLGLARWLVAKNHPLMARVTVNRYWAMFFGNGFVKTINDFGAQGEWPSHPELIDWLAVQFRDGGRISGTRGTHRDVTPWNTRELVRAIVTSATYRQSAAVTPAKLERDRYNRLLSRGPRLRLDAEFIRDNALAVAGLLDRGIGGPSVKPYQPSGIWDGTDARYDQDHGEKLYRRGMYVFWRRSAHYPSFATFDAPNREVCTFLRQRTQTPLQSLVLMNDPVYVEAARALAQRAWKEEPRDPAKRLVRAFRHTLGRMPVPEEIAALRRTHDEQLAGFRADPKAAEALLKIGESPAPKDIPADELAALTAVANVLLNLNETIIR